GDGRTQAFCALGPPRGISISFQSRRWRFHIRHRGLDIRPASCPERLRATTGRATVRQRSLRSSLERQGTRVLSTSLDIAALYRGHRTQLEQYFRRRVADPELARDLTAETFLRAFCGQQRFSGTHDDE